LIFNLIKDTEWRTRILGLKMIFRLFERNKDLIAHLNIKNLINDPNSKISQLISSRNTFQILSEKGTDPCVYYCPPKPKMNL